MGVDIDDSWEKFYNSIQSNATKAALTHCWSGSDEGTCSVNVTHTTNDEGENTGNAGLDYSFATGRPNIVSPFTKSIIFTVKDIPGVDPHVATFFIEGLYSKGPGNSFALPTHEPIMILRDPPGGSSSATYEYVQSTVRIVEAESEASMAFAVQGELEGTVEVDAELCTGKNLCIVPWNKNHLNLTALYSLFHFITLCLYRWRFGCNRFSLRTNSGKFYVAICGLYGQVFVAILSFIKQRRDLNL